MATPIARFVIDKNNGRGEISLPLADGKRRPKDFVVKDGGEGKLISAIFNKDGDNAKVFAPDRASEVEDARVPECLVDGRYLEVANVTYLLQSDQDKTGQQGIRLGQGSKSWTFGGRVSSSNYWIDPSKLQLPLLEERVKQGGCVLVQAAYRSGKSTHLYALYNKLKSYEDCLPILITLFQFDAATENFWVKLSNQLKIYFPTAHVTSEEEFKALFTHAKIGAKRVVLLFDEFQNVVDSVVKEPLLGAFKTLWDDRGALYNVQAILCFGTYSLDMLTNVSGQQAWRTRLSPFAKDKTVYIQPLPAEETKELFVQFGNDIGVTFAPAVLDDIYQTTNGYAGVVGFVGLQLANAEELGEFQKPEQIDLVWWLRFRARIPDKLAKQEQFQKLVKCVQHEPDLERLALYLLGKEDPFEIEGEYTEAACTLGDYGLIRFDVFSSKWSISSLFLRELIYYAFSDQHRIAPWPLTVLDEPYVLVQKAMECVDRTQLKHCSLNKTTNFPSEYAFQGELFSVLRSALQQYREDYFVMLEAKKDRKRADLLVKNGKRIVIEVKSAAYFWSTASTLAASIEQAAGYGAEYHADKVLLINFIPTGRGDIRCGAMYNSTQHTGVTVSVFQILCDNEFNMTLLE